MILDCTLIGFSVIVFKPVDGVWQPWIMIGVTFLLFSHFAPSNYPIVLVLINQPPDLTWASTLLGIVHKQMYVSFFLYSLTE